MKYKIIPSGWYPKQPSALPESRTKQGSLTHFVNVTGLVAETTRLVDELSLLIRNLKLHL